VLKLLTDGRHEIGQAATHSRIDLPNSSASDQLGKQAGAFDDQIVEMQRIVAKPQAYLFVIKRSDPPRSYGPRK